MNAKTLITLAIALLGAASAFADHHDDSGLSRADVSTALAQARISGELHHGDREINILPAGTTLKTRAQVQAETAEALRLNVVSRSEANIFPTDAQLHAVRVAGLKALPEQDAAR
nr:DUF4148 domain-containing protein [uncultured Roseateles sp.]